MSNKPQAYIFVGRSGCGKGTQAAKLADTLQAKDPSSKVLHIETGSELRKLALRPGFTAKLTKDVLEHGGFLPVFMTVHCWSDVLVSDFDGTQNVIFDGTPRKVGEAQVLDSVFPFYGFGNIWVIYINVDHDESTKRLKLRGRSDDTEVDIVERMKWYESEVVPVIEHYISNPNVNFLDINGVQAIELVHADIVKKVGLA